MATKTELTNIIEHRVLGVHLGWVYRKDGDWYSGPNSQQRPSLGPYASEAEATEALDQWVMENGGGVRTARHIGTRAGAYALIAERTDEYYGEYSSRQASGEVTYLTSDGDRPMNSVRWEIDKDGEIDFNAASGLGTTLEAEAKAYAILAAVSMAQVVAAGLV